MSKHEATTAPGGGKVWFSVVASAGCAWRATTTADWITLVNNAWIEVGVYVQTHGDGPGTVGFTVAANDTGRARQGIVDVGRVTFTVTQDPCAYTLSTGSQNVSAGGGKAWFQMFSACGCDWTASASAAWIFAPVCRMAPDEVKRTAPKRRPRTTTHRLRRRTTA